ncbi:hypothetical protein [Psychrobacter sp. I-STPA6b]|uniref:hypothetical protein n=1 Tax=Psychrobacter sp. I-STPA6b TaxID=2585718 RepID=UPI001D0C9F81|nr:hypothetical protein [Psychrobacter sp. I-STPA6b]
MMTKDILSTSLDNHLKAILQQIKQLSQVHAEDCGSCSSIVLIQIPVIMWYR